MFADCLNMAKTARESADTTRCEQSAHWLELSQHGTERATRSWPDSMSHFQMHFGLSATLSCWRQSSKCKRGVFQDAQFCWRNDRFNVNILWNALYFLVIAHFVPISWACKEQTAVSHSSPESALISWDTMLSRLNELSQNARRCRNPSIMFHETHHGPVIVLTYSLLKAMRLLSR